MCERTGDGSRYPKALGDRERPPLGPRRRFREDASRVRDRTAARNLALLRRIALNLARADDSLKASLKGKRRSAAWDNTYMARLIAG